MVLPREPARHPLDGGTGQGQVRIVSGGGSGHLPIFTGYVGRGLLDACAIGNVFASPPVNDVAEAIRTANGGGGAAAYAGLPLGEVTRIARKSGLRPKASTRRQRSSPGRTRLSLTHLAPSEAAPTRSGGRASAAERTIGVDDPGMVALKRMIESLKS